MRTLALKTPENVSVDFEIAGVSQRSLAFAVDCAVVGGLTLALWLAVWALGALAGAGDGVVGAAFGTGWFLLRHSYFAWTELRFHGRTPGKRAAGVRVIARDGGPLTGPRVVARNLTRELELFLPLTVIVLGDSLLPDAPGWVRGVALVWALGLLLFPLTNRHRARVGDLLAGTAVVISPKARLLPDLARKQRRLHGFTEAQLDLYGIRELQVLEGVLRRDFPEPQLLAEIAARIVKKINWQGTIADDRTFLEDFYAAQRARLEHRMLMGERREHKR